jgi:hypothetical protein
MPKCGNISVRPTSRRDDIARAKAQLEAIEKICGRGCEEYTDLAEAIADPSKL